MLLEKVIGAGLWELTLAMYTMFLTLCQTIAQISEGWAGCEQKKKKKRCSAPRTAPRCACQPNRTGPARGSWQQPPRLSGPSSLPVLVIRSISNDSLMPLCIFTGDSLVTENTLFKKTPKLVYQILANIWCFQCITSFITHTRTNVAAIICIL